MNDEFKIEIDTIGSGYGFIDLLPELLSDVENEYGTEERDKVEKWAKASKKNDEYISADGRMHIYNCGKQMDIMLERGI